MSGPFEVPLSGSRAMVVSSPAMVGFRTEFIAKVFEHWIEAGRNTGPSEVPLSGSRTELAKWPSAGGSKCGKNYGELHDVGVLILRLENVK